MPAIVSTRSIRAGAGSRGMAPYRGVPAGFAGTSG
jgi:hypothetical protein